MSDGMAPPRSFFWRDSLHVTRPTQAGFSRPVPVVFVEGLPAIFTCCSHDVFLLVKIKIISIIAFFAVPAEALFRADFMAAKRDSAGLLLLFLFICFWSGGSLSRRRCGGERRLRGY